MTILKWITKDTNIDFMKARVFTYALSIILVVISKGALYFINSTISFFTIAGFFNE